MLPYKNRLLKKKDFEKVFKKGKKIQQDSFCLRTIDNDLDYTRFGLIISKKVCPKAVNRNRIKRKLRHLIKFLLPDIKKGKDVVLIVLKEKEEMSLNQILQRAKLL
ncbi:MAG: ribonuclease P protein component [Candidatus Pacebacteria bacterium]|nr:ribonuclease P protein component [Candidatus Paceibacterota bacterium]